MWKRPIGFSEMQSCLPMADAVNPSDQSSFRCAILSPVQLNGFHVVLILITRILSGREAPKSLHRAKDSGQAHFSEPEEAQFILDGYRLGGWRNDQSREGESLYCSCQSNRVSTRVSPYVEEGDVPPNRR